MKTLITLLVVGMVSIASVAHADETPKTNEVATKPNSFCQFFCVGNTCMTCCTHNGQTTCSDNSVTSKDDPK